jgi:hypothetical protein
MKIVQDERTRHGQKIYSEFEYKFLGKLTSGTQVRPKKDHYLATSYMGCIHHYSSTPPLQDNEGGSRTAVTVPTSHHDRSRRTVWNCIAYG